MKNKVILDFDGIFAANMMYSIEGKVMKTFPWGVRHTIDLLNKHGFKVYIISGDSTPGGQGITRKFCENLNIEEIIFIKSHEKLNHLKDNFNLDECIYAGDDIYDIEIFKEVYGITTSEAHEAFDVTVDYRSKYSTSDYFFMDLGLHIIQTFVMDSYMADADIATFYYSIGTETTHRPFNKMLLDQRYQNVFIIQQYSMRNHTDGIYNPLLDGNLNLTLHRIYHSLMKKPDMVVSITIPNSINEVELKFLKEFTKKEFDDRVKFIPIEYGINAYENRKKFDEITKLDSKFLLGSDLIISDFEGISSNIAPIVYNFNISKVPDLDRWYVDEFFESQANRVSSATSAYVLNENQKEYFVESCETQVQAMDVSGTVIVDSEIINKTLFMKQVKFFISLLDDDMKIKVESFMSKEVMNCDQLFFMPFRLTDECYNFNDGNQSK